MPSLRELQRGFVAATVFGDTAALAGLGIVAGALDPAARIAIYRNNALGNYRKALAATYPVVRRLVGGPFFDAAIDAFVRAHPSPRGDVNRYGGELARSGAYLRPRAAVFTRVARLDGDDQANNAATPPFIRPRCAAYRLAGRVRVSHLRPTRRLADPISHLQVNQRGPGRRVDLGESATLGAARLRRRRVEPCGGRTRVLPRSPAIELEDAIDALPLRSVVRPGRTLKAPSGGSSSPFAPSNVPRGSHDGAPPHFGVSRALSARRALSQAQTCSARLRLYVARVFLWSHSQDPRWSVTLAPSTTNITCRYAPPGVPRPRDCHRASLRCCWRGRGLALRCRVWSIQISSRSRTGLPEPR